MDALLKGNVIPSTPSGGCSQIPQLGLIASYLLQGTAEDETGTFNGTESSATYAYNDERGVVYNGGGSITIPSTGGTYCVYWVNTGSGWTHYSGATIPSSLTTNKYSNLHIYNRTLSAGEITDIYNIEKYQHNNALDQGLVAYYPLDGNSLDNAINQYDGTDTSVAYVADGTFGTVLECGAGNISIPSATGFIEQYYWEDTGTGWTHIKTTTQKNSFTTNKYAHIRKYNRAVSAKELSIMQDIEKKLLCPYNSTIDNPDPFEDGSGIALYKMDGNANDTTGVYDGTPTSITYADGEFGQCAVFNGTSSNIRNLSVSIGSSSFTYHCTFACTNVSPAVQNNFIDFSVNRGTLMVYGTNIRYYDNTSWRVFSYVLSNNTQYTISLSVNGTSASLYVNGVFSETLSGASITLSGSMGIGSNSLGTSSYFSGKIDQFRIFNRAITASEVTILANERKV
jgi:hypothetical protein